MNRLALIFALFLIIIPLQSMAHHAAVDIIDADLWEMIDDMVADTPHAELDFDDMGTDDTGMITTTITGTERAIENLIDDGLLDTVSQLSGDVYVTIEFTEDGTVLTIVQTPSGTD